MHVGSPIAPYRSLAVNRTFWYKIPPADPTSKESGTCSAISRLAGPTTEANSSQSQFYFDETALTMQAVPVAHSSTCRVLSTFQSPVRLAILKIMARSGFQVTQNVDNFLRDKPSTRLHAPPGGGSSMGSLIFGGGDNSSPFAGHERHSMRRKVESPELSNPYAKDNRRGGYNDAPSNINQPPPGQQSQSLVRAGSSSNQYASGSNQNYGNVLTDRRITRIHAPPGGVSSIRFG